MQMCEPRFLVCVIFYFFDRNKVLDTVILLLFIYDNLSMLKFFLSFQDMLHFVIAVSYYFSGIKKNTKQIETFALYF